MANKFNICYYRQTFGTKVAEEEAVVQTLRLLLLDVTGVGGGNFQYLPGL